MAHRWSPRWRPLRQAHRRAASPARGSCALNAMRRAAWRSHCVRSSTTRSTISRSSQPTSWTQAPTARGSTYPRSRPSRPTPCLLAPTWCQPRWGRSVGMGMGLLSGTSSVVHGGGSMVWGAARKKNVASTALSVVPSADTLAAPSTTIKKLISYFFSFRTSFLAHHAHIL